MCVFFNENRQKNEDFQVKNTQIKKKKKIKKTKILFILSKLAATKSLSKIN